MKQITIKVGKDNPEDDYMALVEIFKTRFPDQIKVHDAIVIETDVPEVFALFSVLVGTKAIAGENGNGQGNGKKTWARYECIDCGGKITQKGKRCMTCAMKFNSDKKRTKGVLVEDEADLDALKDSGLVEQV